MTLQRRILNKKPKPEHAVPEYVVLSGRWAAAAARHSISSFRVKYVRNGRVHMCNAAGMTSRDINLAIMSIQD